MKKIYSKPTIDVVKVKVQTSLLVGSELDVKDSAATEWGSRRGGDFWDDED